MIFYDNYQTKTPSHPCIYVLILLNITFTFQIMFYDYVFHYFFKILFVLLRNLFY